MPLKSLSPFFFHRSTGMLALMAAGLLQSASLATAATEALADAEHRVVGDLMQWHKVTVELGGPFTSEVATVNPFFDYRMEVTFTQDDTEIVVPGYFAADGDAANTGATSGNVWRAHFNPPATGTWNYEINVYEGTNCAPNRDGSLIPAYTGLTGTFSVAPTDKTGRDFRAHGWLQYVGEHYLQFQGSGQYFFKAGPGDPENFLGYTEFDNTPRALHAYTPHAQDWQSGDPIWGNPARGQEIIGMINYLADAGTNTLYFLFWTGGDAKDAEPWTSETAYRRYDTSKLDQWAIVFDHMQEKGIHLHAYFFEQEIDNTLDGRGVFGVERKVYIRELIARFGYLNAITWNLGEEIDIASTNNGWDGYMGDANVREFGTYVRDLDPYDHSIGVHIKTDDVYRDTSIPAKLLGEPWYDNFTIYTDDTLSESREATLANREKSLNDSGIKMVFTSDEQGVQGQGIDANAGSMDDYRREVLWGGLMAGGAGAEYYFAGNDNTYHTIRIENMRGYDQAWQECGHAIRFFEAFDIDFASMNPDFSLVTNGWCLANPGSEYVIYLPYGGTTSLDLSAYGTDSFDLYWYDPRNGGSLQQGALKSVPGGGVANLGNAPVSSSSDWVILVRQRTGTQEPAAPEIVQQPTDSAAPIGGNAIFTVLASGYPQPDYQWYVDGSPVGSNSNSLIIESISQADAGKSVHVVVSNTQGQVTSASATMQIVDTLEEAGGRLIWQIETRPATGAWQTPSSDQWDDLEGFTGSTYYEYHGPNNYGAPDPNSMIEFSVKINTPGPYYFALRSQTVDIDTEYDLANDIWIRFPSDPGALSEWHKYYDPNREKWSWDGWTEGQGQPRVTLSTGTHTIQLAGRSHGFGIDAAALFQSASDRAELDALMHVTPPANPTGLTAVAQGSDSIKLTWEDNSTDEQGFRLLRQVDSNLFVVFRGVAADVTTYTVTGLDPETTYTYVVLAYNSNGRSNYTNEASATTESEASLPYMLTNATDLTEGYYQTWFGLVYAEDWPWVYSFEVGFLFADAPGNANESAWLYMLNPAMQGWFWASEVMPHWVYGQPAGHSLGWWYLAVPEGSSAFYLFSPDGSTIITGAR